MDLPEPAIFELAHVWVSLHGRAAEPHLNHLIDRMQKSSDLDSAATYRRILEQVHALRAGHDGPQPAEKSPAIAGASKF